MADLNSKDAWVSVPVKPTPEMLAAFWRQKNCGSQDVAVRFGEGEAFSDYDAYAAMLAARPQPEGAPDALVERARRIAYEVDAADRYKGWDADTLARHESEFGRKADYERGEYDAGQLVRCALAALTAAQPVESQNG